MQEPAQSAESSNPYAALDTQPGETPTARASGQTIRLLKGTRRWVLFMAILLFVLAGLAALSVAFYVRLLSLLIGDPMLSPITRGLMQMSAMAVLLSTSAVYLWRYAARAKEFTRKPGRRSLNAVFTAERSFWTISGVLLVIAFGVQILIAAGQILAAWIVILE